MVRNPDILRKKWRDAKAEISRLQKQHARELKEARLDIPKELDLLRRENQKLRSKVSANDGVVPIIDSILREVYADEDFGWDIPEPPEPERAEEECIAIAHLTDWQCGKITPTYSSEICEARMMEYADKINKAIHVHNGNRGIDTLHVYWTGDMVEGELIFPHQAHLIDQSVFDQACRLVPSIMTRQIVTWLQTFKRIKIFAVHGNHGRPASKSAGSHPKTNWDRVAYHTAKLMIGLMVSQSGVDPSRVSIEIADDFYIIDEALGHNNLLIHGDQGIRGHGGIPWYGINKKMAGWIDSVPAKWDNMYFGHFHQMVSADFNGRRWYCGGTPESDNEWARAELAAAGRPQQRLQILNAEQVVCDLPVYLNYGYRD